ncbi:phosphatase PAP2 family protein [Pontibacter ruber]|uniref:Phosphatase PAP2 family protein n=1 Tax=Pontibacter ruber TaxID=1343895 RepID=A0ABW5D1T8_9BACT|nr:phosphatase PAP2 family protein [Pontibacter ruber]
MTSFNRTPRSYLGKVWLIVLAILTSCPLQAQTVLVNPDLTAEKYLPNTGPYSHSTAYPDTLSKPSRLSPVLKGGAMLVAGAGIWAATFAWADESLQQYTQQHRTVSLDKLASVVQPLGRQRYMMPVAGAAIAGGMILKDSKLQKAGIVSLGSILISAGVTSTLKNEFHRYRPSVTAENHFFDGPIHTSDNTSLPSAHTATAFAVATSVASVYGNEYRYVPPIAYGVATLVGLSRINDNVHWATDVMAGAVVGYLSAKGSLYLYDMTSQKLKIRRQRLMITPQPGLHSGGVSATLVF